MTSPPSDIYFLFITTSSSQRYNKISSTPGKSSQQSKHFDTTLNSRTRIPTTMPPLPTSALRDLFWERAYYDHVDHEGISHTQDGTSAWGESGPSSSILTLPQMDLPFRSTSFCLVYALVIGGSICLVLLVLSTVYKQDYIRSDNRHAPRTPDQSTPTSASIPRLEPEKVDEDPRTRTQLHLQGEGIAR